MLLLIQLWEYNYLQKNQEIFIFPIFRKNNTILHGEAIIRADEIFLSRIRDKKYFRLETQEQTGVSQINFWSRIIIL